MKQVLISCGVIVVLCLVIIGIYEKQNHNISQNTTGGGYANEHQLALALGVRHTF